MILEFIGYGTGLRRFVLANTAWVEAVYALLGRWCGKKPAFGCCGELYVRYLGDFWVQKSIFAKYDFYVFSTLNHKPK